MYILGINAYHGDSSAAIYKDGVLIAATEEERIRRLKHWAGLPVEAIKFCLKEASISLKDVDYITVSRNPLAKFDKKILHSLQKMVSITAIRDRAGNAAKITNLKKDLATQLGFDPSQIRAKIKYIEHHRSHIASAFFVSPFEEAAILSVDGFGDFTSTMRAFGRGNQIEVLDSVSYPHSLGVFYTAFTQFLGFPYYGDEYKIMGLAPYGKPTELAKLRDVVQLKKNGRFELNEKYFRHFKEGVSMSWQSGDPHIETLFSDYLVQQFGKPRQKDEPLTDYHKNLATSVQRLCEEALFHMLHDLYLKTNSKNLCITGGVAQNSVANGKIVAQTPFEHLFIPPAGHDAGTSVGSALYHFHHNLRHSRLAFKHEAYTGAQFSNEHIMAYLNEKGIAYECYNDDVIYAMVTECLVNGGVVGWFQGRAEFGPRALGNRSILADPRRADAKDILNQKIKRRESFRPFAPSILREFTGEYFEMEDSVPFMEKVFPIKPEKHAIIPAVTHVDGTGRLQTVEEKDNPRYYQLIKHFYEKTGVPILLNTSFNENEPIVNSPEHALDCYLRTRMDMLVMENVVVSRVA